MATETSYTSALWEVIKIWVITLADTYGEGSQRVMFVCKIVSNTKAEDTAFNLKTSQTHKGFLLKFGSAFLLKLRITGITQ